MTSINAPEKFPIVTGPGVSSVTDPVMVLWRDGAMTTAQTHRSDAVTPDVVQLGLFESDEHESPAFVHPRHRAFAALLFRAPAHEDAALEVLSLVEPELGVLAGRLVRLGIEPDIARGEALSVAWEVVAGHRLGPVLPTRPCLAAVIWTELRRELRVRRHRGIELVPLNDEVDIPAPEVEPLEDGVGLLDAAVAAGVINAHQAVVVRHTRIEGRGLDEVAADLRRPYHAVRKDRQRAERALATFAAFYYAEGPR
jgi:hypothetical protein